MRIPFLLKNYKKNQPKNRRKIHRKTALKIVSKIGFIVIFYALFFSELTYGQSHEKSKSTPKSVSKDTICRHTIRGFIFDQETHIPLVDANIFIPSLKKGTVSNKQGFFELKNVCLGEYHIFFSHIGCETQTQFLSFSDDTTLSIHLLHYEELLHEIEVIAEQELSTTAKHTLSEAHITTQSHKNLADVLENISGVSTLKSGAGISKPVIHGLYGNRVAILNQGIVHTGQQWGNDHAPEIDVFSANNITVIKSAAALQYGGSALGNIIKIESAPIKKDPHLHGQLNYIFQSNGRGHTLNSKLEKQSSWFAWRLTGTIKKKGSLHTPDYFLTNTGKRENNVSFQLEKTIKNQLFIKAHYSIFNAENGIFRGSHIGNLTDLKTAIGKEKPFFATSKFGYSIGAPRQKVTHQLLKLEAEYLPNEKNSWELRYGGQSDLREEFDIRRGGRSNKPALSLLQHSHFLETVYHRFLETDHEFTVALQYKNIDNLNDAKTGILPLIPNYFTHQTALFFSFQKKSNVLSYQLGGRYEFQNLYASTISRSLPRKIESFEHQFHNYAFSAGITKRIQEIWNTNLDVGLMRRSPQVNELYSYGLHQGVSGIEVGKRNMREEQSIKMIWHNDISTSDHFFIQSIFYTQFIRNYIYLEPQNTFVLTIRGAFPLYHYEQTHALIYGSDFLLSYEPHDQIKLVTKYALVRGKDQTNDQPLVFMPSDNLSTKIQYSWDEKAKRKNTFLALEGKYVFKQNQLNAEQDFLAPPKGYFLLNMEAKTSFLIRDSKLDFNLQLENMLNRRYRDYMNRQRYFADEIGFSASLGINYKF